MWRIRPLMAAGLLLAVSLCAQPSHGSTEFKTVETSTPQEVAGAMSLKLVRGVSNAALGWWELPKQVYNDISRGWGCDGAFRRTSQGDRHDAGQNVERRG